MNTVGLILLLCASILAVARPNEDSARGSPTHRQTQQVGKITKLRLINTDTDKPFIGYDPLPKKSIVDVTTLSTENLSIEAITDVSVGSIQWDYNGVRRTEDSPAWSLCGNNGADFFACPRLKIGSNATITATPFSGRGASGIRGTEVSVSLSLFKNNTKPPLSMSLTLINSVTDKDIGSLKNNTVIDLALTPKVNIRANVNPSVMIASVQFKTNGKVTRTENGAPFAYSGNSGNDYFDWAPKVGRFTIEAMAYSERDAMGTLWSTETVTIVVVKSTLAPVSTLKPMNTPTTTNAPNVSPTLDITPPKLLTLAILTPTVDVSAGPAQGVFQLTVQDDQAGLARAIVGVNGALSPFFSASNEFNTDSPSPGTVTLNISLTFDKYIRQEKYRLYVNLRDDAWNWNDLYNPTLKARGFPHEIQVINSNEDLFGPELVSFKALTPTKIDVSTGPASVTFQIVAKDMMYGVDSATIFARSSIRTIEKFVPLSVPVIGTHVFTMTLEFPAFTKPTNYSLEVDLNDASFFNTNVTNATALAKRNFPSIIEVVNTNADTTPPLFLNMTQSGSTIVNASGTNPYISFQVYSSDMQSGFWYGFIKATYDNGKTIVKGPRYIPFPIIGEFPFSGFFDFNKDSWRGNYNLSVYLEDDEDNSVTIGTVELMARGFPAMFTVV